MDFTDIDRRREAAGISQYALCREAGVHPTTYYRLRRDPETGQRRTLVKLQRGLDALIEGRAA